MAAPGATGRHCQDRGMIALEVPAVRATVLGSGFGVSATSGATFDLRRAIRSAGYGINRLCSASHPDGIAFQPIADLIQPEDAGVCFQPGDLFGIHGRHFDRGSLPAASNARVLSLRALARHTPLDNRN